ncbi:uncharacterized protein Bfra_001261 [Botrytis fragariae]|uniref:Transcription factor domain-containing protein n=1 Tax=Botrytis fragariae TaxID=1964551 RepID=A0A8H6B0I3_9HELO|nr:uncharacterized protein Bfra_001261 [Botrytis fragariae]KAF5876905.1 hypothetical protein Bfra_001261 [Botrytis fragariae]
MTTNTLPEDGKYTFITSTPSCSAKGKQETKTLVRRHVMRPFMKQNRPKRANDLKNIAPRSFVGASPLQMSISHTNRERLDAESEADVKSGVLMGLQTNSMILLGNGRVNPFQAWPVKMDTQEHELVYHIWDPAQCFQPFRDFWFPLGTNDSAAMHLVLANVALHLNALKGNREEDRDSMMYHLSAIRSVNRRLAHFEVENSDGILGAILGHLLSNSERWKIHQTGFYKILSLRGGLSSIENIPSIRLSLFWIEHNMSSDLDIVPLSPPPVQYLTNPYLLRYQADGEACFVSICEHSAITSFVSVEILDIMRQLSILTVTIARENQKRNLSKDAQFLWGDQNFAGLCVYPILSRLLTTQKDIKHEIEDLCRIGGLLFIAQTRRWFGVAPVLTNVLITKLRRLLESDGDVWNAKVNSLRVWTLVMAGCAATTEDERSWIAETLKRDVFDWSELENVKDMWWIDEIFQVGLLNMETAFYTLQEIN